MLAIHIFLGIIIVLSLGIFMFYFMMEGFMTQAEADAIRGSLPYGGADSETICKAQTTCGDCLNEDPSSGKHLGIDCGWCATARACVPRSGMYRIIPAWLQDLILSKDKPDCPAKDFVYSKGQCGGSVCSDFTNCRDCAASAILGDKSACGWCAQTGKCLDRLEAEKSFNDYYSAGGGSSGLPAPLCDTEDSSGSYKHSPGTPLIFDTGMCPVQKCSEIKDCGTCTNTTGCGYCATTSTCVAINESGSSIEGSGGSSCAQGSIIRQLYQCPCSTLSVCTDCAQRPGCGYCSTNKTCINLDKDGIPKKDPVTKKPACDVDNLATSAGQCSPITSNPLGSSLGPKRWEGNGSQQGPYKPDAEELALAGGNYLLGGNELNGPGNYLGATGTGSGAVSPPTRYPYIFGNGVLRRVGQSSVPGGISRSADLEASPLEDYVKLLVRSELASEGVPMNEP